MRLFLAFLFFCIAGFADTAQVIGIGNAAVDLLVPIEDAFFEKTDLTKGGAKLVDWSVFSQLPEESQRAAGGSAANVMKGLARLGVPTAFLGKIGSDEKGAYFETSLVDHGIESLLQRIETPTTQIACMITPDGEKSMYIYAGAGAELSEEALSPELFSDRSLLHIDGYMLWNRSILPEALAMAKAQNLRVSIDLGCSELMVQFRELVLDLIPRYVDILFGNQEEIEILTGMNLQESLVFLGSLCPAVVVKVGQEGCWVAAHGKVFHSPGVVADKVVDTTGAGDLFASGFLYGYLHQYALEDCARFGNIVGSAAVENYGAEIPEAKWPEIRRQIPNLKNKHLILMGCPGSGKGTLAQYLQTQGNYYAFSFGDAIRAEIANKTAIGLACEEVVVSGGLVTDEIGQELFEQHFNEATRQGQLFILDGMIQKQHYVDYFDAYIRSKGLEFGYVYLKANQETASKRICSRLVCTSCNTISSATKNCESCNQEFVIRPDDANPNATKRRLNRFFNDTISLVDQYKHRPNSTSNVRKNLLLIFRSCEQFICCEEEGEALVVSIVGLSVFLNFVSRFRLIHSKFVFQNGNRGQISGIHCGHDRF